MDLLNRGYRGLQELDKEVEKYFVSSGFAFVHSDSSADVCAVEAVKLDDLDPEAVKAGLAEYNAKLGSLQVRPMPPPPPPPGALLFLSVPFLLLVLQSCSSCPRLWLSLAEKP